MHFYLQQHTPYFTSKQNAKAQRRKVLKRMENEISHKIIGAAIEVHRILGGPGLLESIYEGSLCYELTSRGLQIQRQLLVPVKYKNVVVREPLCLDILVDKKVIIEVKATEKEHTIYKAQLLTYLRLTGMKLGLLINFGTEHVKDGIHRVVNGL
jgi:GxxExxY protein